MKKHHVNFLFKGAVEIQRRKPETLGANTQIYDWIPQNDLLGK